MKLLKCVKKRSCSEVAMEKKTIWILFNTKDFYENTMPSCMKWWAVPVTYERREWPVKTSSARKATKKKLAWKRVASPWKWKPWWSNKPQTDATSEFCLAANQVNSASLDYSSIMGTVRDSQAEALMMLSLLHPEVDAVYDFSGNAEHFDDIKMFERFGDITSRYKKISMC